MAAPVISAVTTDSKSYAKGSKMTLIVSYSDPDAKTLTISVFATDAEGNKSATSTVQVAITDPVTLSVSDDSGNVWTKVTDTGSVATFTATA